MKIYMPIIIYHDGIQRFKQKFLNLSSYNILRNSNLNTSVTLVKKNVSSSSTLIS